MSRTMPNIERLRTENQQLIYSMNIHSRGHLLGAEELTFVPAAALNLEEPSGRVGKTKP